MTSHEGIVIAENLSREFFRGTERVIALESASFNITAGEMVALTGPSGAGKTTLLNLVGCMDIPTSGRLIVNKKEVQILSSAEQTLLRRNYIGFVFQHFGLIPTLTVRENINLPLLFGHKIEYHEDAEKLLERVGLSKRADHRPHELSGGEMQRAAIARALIRKPILLLADEPTGNLDSQTGKQIIELFQDLNREGLTILVSTHNQALAEQCPVQLNVVDGRVTCRS